MRMELEGIALVTAELDVEMELGGLARLQVPTSTFFGSLHFVSVCVSGRSYSFMKY